MNSGLTYEQETFVKDSIPIRLGKLANNLARIQSSYSDSIHEDVVKSLIRGCLKSFGESKIKPIASP